MESSETGAMQPDRRRPAHQLTAASRLNAARAAAGILPPAAQFQAKELAKQLRPLLASASAPVLLDAARRPSEAFMTPKPPSPRVLPPLTETPVLPPSPADPASERPKVERTVTKRGNWIVPDHRPAQDELFEDAAEAALYTACHWPLHVWKRETKKGRQLQTQVTERLFDGISRLRAFRLWRVTSEKRKIYRAADKKVSKGVRRENLMRYFRRLSAHVMHLKKVAEVESSDIYIKLRARRVGARPFLAWHVFTTCRALVRRRCYGELLLRTERMVHPLPCAFPRASLAPLAHAVQPHA